MSYIPEAAYYSEMLVSLPHSGKHRGMGFKMCGDIVNQIKKKMAYPPPLASFDLMML